MPIRYRIDSERRLVVAAGFGEVHHEDVFGYQQTVWARPDVKGFDELVDMTRVEHIVLPSTESIKRLAELSAGMDDPARPSRFAVVAPAHLSFGLGRMFQMHRELDPRSTKKVGVFRTLDEALAYLGITQPVELPAPE
jgi:hypothetical protein